MTDTIEEAWGMKSGLSILRIIKSVTGKGHPYKYLKNGAPQTSDLVVYRAPDPNDLIWKNLGATASEKFKRRLLTFCATFLLLCLSFGAILGLKIAQYVLYTDNKIEATGLRVISILITLVVSTINLALGYMIRRLTVEEYHETESSYFRSLMIKTVLARLFNTNLLVIIAHVIVYKPRQAIYGKGRLCSAGALLTDAWFILLYQAVATPFLTFFDYRKIIKIVRRWWLKRQILNHPKRVTVTQEEAQALFEDPSFNPSLAYGHFCLLYITMVFFQPILPMGAVTGLVALVLTYYAYKKMLLRDSKRPVLISKEIPLITLYLLNLTPLCYGVNLIDQISSAIFDKILTDDITNYSWSILAIGMISVFLPLYLLIYDLLSICRKANKVLSKEQNYDEDYDNIRTKFMNEYDRANPITKDQALKEYLHYMASRPLSPSQNPGPHRAHGNERQILILRTKKQSTRISTC